MHILNVQHKSTLAILVGLVLVALLVLRFLKPRKGMVSKTEAFAASPLVGYRLPQVEIKKSSTIGERGVFAVRDYAAGETIEVCPCIKQENCYIDGEVNNYVFSYDDDHSLIGFGYCSMYNHSDSNNAEWDVLNENQIQVKTIKSIRKGEEIFISYGDEYWADRGGKI